MSHACLAVHYPTAPSPNVPRITVPRTPNMGPSPANVNRARSFNLVAVVAAVMTAEPTKPAEAKTEAKEAWHLVGVAGLHYDRSRVCRHRVGLRITISIGRCTEECPMAPTTMIVMPALCRSSTSECGGSYQSSNQSLHRGDLLTRVEAPQTRVYGVVNIHDLMAKSCLPHEATPLLVYHA